MRISLTQVSKCFSFGRNSVQALNNISVEISAGEIIALMGPSGSGKSTMLNLIGALDKPTSGQISVNGHDISGLSRNEQATFRNATIGFVFQTFNLIPVLTALENVLLPFQLGRSEEQHGEAKKRAITLLEKVGLEKQAMQRVNQLSGGQMQRVAIARALINRPQIVLADEPTANLDHETAHVVLSTLRDLCQEESSTAIISTHDIEVIPYCQRVISLKDGRLTGDKKA